ncbi:hypothetical protein PIB30_052082 [Stylosanthes scabra]|uniref:Uncharacterized protein n=1 Tax=Stylosanthes scabra TaxID=79078 RepID=A0ABU6ZGU5_9FABA|nr:hypothetical protein [Stylosanthes scabra]
MPDWLCLYVDGSLIIFEGSLLSLSENIYCLGRCSFGGHHTDQLSFGSYHRSGYDLIRRFGVGGPSFRLYASTWLTSTTWTRCRDSSALTSRFRWTKLTSTGSLRRQVGAMTYGGPHIAPPEHGVRVGCDTRQTLSSFRLSLSQTSVATGSIWIGQVVGRRLSTPTVTTLSPTPTATYGPADSSKRCP